ncbi:hypothetical protein FNV43_RR11179 [Rhamnella rubrinervis]|uniref:Uncharacterized protein n=1 Tax=Rhamnella rubrinervis TaxID=2594499 RepID=A0A8K0MHD9_9ROSA|nr:hypothetical protein FNV43_RR11179 [Rhamnella rubrinervis]
MVRWITSLKASSVQTLWLPTRRGRVELASTVSSEGNVQENMEHDAKNIDASVMESKMEPIWVEDGILHIEATRLHANRFDRHAATRRDKASEATTFDSPYHCCESRREESIHFQSWRMGLSMRAVSLPAEDNQENGSMAGLRQHHVGDACVQRKPRTTSIYDKERLVRGRKNHPVMSTYVKRKGDEGEASLEPATTALAIRGLSRGFHTRSRRGVGMGGENVTVAFHRTHCGVFYLGESVWSSTDVCRTFRRF